MIVFLSSDQDIKRNKKKKKQYPLSAMTWQLNKIFTPRIIGFNLYFIVYYMI